MCLGTRQHPRAPPHSYPSIPTARDRSDWKSTAVAPLGIVQANPCPIDAGFPFFRVPGQVSPEFTGGGQMSWLWKGFVTVWRHLRG